MKSVNKWTLPLVGGAVGLVLSILFLSLGFFKTLLVLVLVAIGVGVGFGLQETGLLENYFNRRY